MKKILIILALLATLSFAEWTMFIGSDSGGKENGINSGTVTFIYNTKTGEVFKYSQRMGKLDNGVLYPKFEGFAPVPYIAQTAKKDGSFEKYIYKWKPF